MTIVSNSSVVMPACVAAMISTMAFSPPASDGFQVAGEHGLERLLVLPLGMLRRERLDAIERERRAGSTSAARTRACRRCRTWRSARRAGRSRARLPSSPWRRSRRSPASIGAVVPRRQRVCAQLWPPRQPDSSGTAASSSVPTYAHHRRLMM